MVIESIELLTPSKHTVEEQKALIDFILALRKSHIKKFLEQHELQKSGTKPDLRERIQDAIKEGQLTLEKIVEFLSQPIDIGATGLEHIGGGRVVEHRQQQMFHRYEFMPLLISRTKSLIEGEFQFFAEHGRTPR